MHLDDRQQAQHYDHIYIAPHLGDAALACGGTIAGQCAAGERVLVVTICTAALPEGPLSSLAEQLHRAWGLTRDEAVAVRLDEDRRALERLGADSLWGGAARRDLPPARHLPQHGCAAGRADRRRSV